MIPDELEELLPAYWTPIGEMGVEYYVSDLDLSYAKDDYVRWSANVHFRSREGFMDFLLARDDIFDGANVRKRLWTATYLCERILEQGRAR